MIKLAKVPVDLILKVLYEIFRAYVLWFESWHATNL